MRGAYLWPLPCDSRRWRTWRPRARSSRPRWDRIRSVAASSLTLRPYRREAQLVAGTPPGPDVLQVVIAQGGLTSSGLSARVSVPCCFARRLQDIESDTGYDTRRRVPEGVPARVSQTTVDDTC